MPAIDTGAAVAFRAGIAGKATFVLLTVVTRLAVTGALIVACFFCICTLCSMAWIGTLELCG